MTDNAVFLITGPSAAGKSTVARLLAERFARGVHVEGDVFRRSIVTGRHEPTPDLSPDALAQLRLRYRLAATVADAYFEAGFTVAVDDVAAGPLLSEYLSFIESRPLHVVVLTPSVETIAARDASRDTSAYEQWSVDELHAGFVDGTPRIGLWLDNSEQTPTETVDAILAHAENSVSRT